MYGCDSCKFLRMRIRELNKQIEAYHRMEMSLKQTRSDYADECTGYNMPVCVDICPAYPACRALEAAKPRPPRKRKRRTDGNSAGKA